jgi:hypothetical protein
MVENFAIDQPGSLHQRAMRDGERRQVERKLAKQWNVNVKQRCWYPLWNNQPTNVLAFWRGAFYDEMGTAKLQTILLDHGINRIWQISKFAPLSGVELDPRLCDFWHLETYWSSHHLYWLIYVSHESSITFAGDWLIGEIKKAWSNWEQHLYTGFSPSP